jgi:hypothetical protein
MNGMRAFLKKGYDACGTVLLDNPEFLELLGGMLDFDPGMRLPPGQACKEAFLANYPPPAQNHQQSL